MSKYINVEELLHASGIHVYKPTKRVMTLIKSWSTEELEPVIHAHFETTEDGYMRCSHCKKDIRYPLISFSDIERCPHCGAHMDDEEEQ